MEPANNVIEFPRKRFTLPDAPRTMEEVDESVDLVKKSHIQDTLELVVPMLFDNLTIAGFNPSEEDAVLLKDGALIAESIRSLLCRLYDIDHPLQTLSSGLFVVGSSPDSFVTTIENPKIIVTVNKPESPEE